VRPTGRGAIGVAGIEVDDKNDAVVGMICVSKGDVSKTVLVVSEKGFGKRTLIEEYRVTNRGGKGVKTISVTDKTGSLVGILDVHDKEDLMITCKSGVTIRMPAYGISEQGRATQGVKLIRVDEGDAIAAITKLDELEASGPAVVLAGNETFFEATEIPGVADADELPGNTVQDDGTGTADENNALPGTEDGSTL